MYAVEEGSKDVLEVLVAAGVDVNQADEVRDINFCVFEAIHHRLSVSCIQILKMIMRHLAIYYF